ncbi:MAG TPA: hypothetical protein VIW67_18000 [Terriglobales bacterium]|jgi:hypothetical protein
MKLIGFLMLVAGCAIALTALPLLTSTARIIFVGAGFAIEVIGLVLVGRSHRPQEDDIG